MKSKPLSDRAAEHVDRTAAKYGWNFESANMEAAWLAGYAAAKRDMAAKAGRAKRKAK